MKKGLLNQTNDGENIFDSKILEERPQINYTIQKRTFIKQHRPPTNGIQMVTAVNSSDTAKTLKKNF